MQPSPPCLLAIADSTRPVFLILMGLSLLLVAWRVARGGSPWAARLMMAGSLLLAFGYAVLLPLYSARVLTPLALLDHVPSGDRSSTVAWHLCKLLSMNAGWLLFGLGLAIHARIFPAVRLTGRCPKPVSP